MFTLFAYLLVSKYTGRYFFHKRVQIGQIYLPGKIFVIPGSPWSSGSSSRGRYAGSNWWFSASAVNVIWFDFSWAVFAMKKKKDHILTRNINRERKRTHHDGHNIMRSLKRHRRRCVKKLMTSPLFVFRFVWIFLFEETSPQLNHGAASGRAPSSRGAVVVGMPHQLHN